MTKKDYELIASIVAEIKFGQREIVAGMFADKLAGTNERFNRSLFLKACGVSE